MVPLPLTSHKNTPVQSGRALWTLSSDIIVLYQASQARCINGSGAPLPIISEWIVNVILILIILKNTHKLQQTSSLFAVVEAGCWLEKHDPSCGGQLDVHDITLLTVRDIWLNGCFRYSVMCNITAHTHTHEQKAPCGCLEMKGSWL